MQIKLHHSLTRVAILLLLLCTTFRNAPANERPLPAGAIAKLSIYRDLRSPSQLQGLAYSPDGKFLAGMTGARIVMVWNAQTGELVKQLETRNYSGTQVFFTPDSSQLVACGSEVDRWNTVDWSPDFLALTSTEAKYEARFIHLGHRIAAYLGQSEKIEVRDVKKKIELFRITRHRYNVQPIVTADDQRVLVPTSDAAGKKFGIEVWDVATKKKLYEFLDFKSVVRVVAVSPDNKTMVAAEGRGQLRRWDLTTGKELDVVPTSNPTTTYIYHLEFSPDSKRIFATASGYLHVFDQKTGVSKKLSMRASRFAVAPDGNHVAIYSGHLATVYDVDSGKVVLPNKADATYEASPGPVGSVISSPDGKRIATTSLMRQVTIWDSAGKVLGQLHAPEGDTRGFRNPTFSANGKKLITHQVYRTQIWNLPTMELEMELPVVGSRGAGSVLSRDRSLAALASYGGAIDLYGLSVTNGSLASLKKYVLRQHTRLVTALSISSDNKLLVSGSRDKSVVLWDVANRRPRHELNGHTDTVSDVAISSNGLHVASAATSDSVRIWSVESGKQVKQFAQKQVVCLAFSPDGQRLVCGLDDGRMVLWNVESGVAEKTLSGHTDGIRDIAFSADGRLLGTGSDDASARIWDIGAGTSLRQFTEHSAAVVTTQFSADGKQFVSGDEMAQVTLWNVETGENIKSSVKAASLGMLTFSMDFRKRRAVLLSDRPGVLIFDFSDGPANARSIGGSPDFSYYGSSSIIRIIRMLPDGKTLAVLHDDQVKFWNVDTGQVLVAFPFGKSFSSSRRMMTWDARWMASIDSSGRSGSGFEVWDMKAGKIAFKVQTTSSEPVYAMRFSAAEEIIVIGTRNGLRFWDLPSGREMPRLTIPGMSVSRFELSPDGTLLAVVSAYTTKVFEVHSGHLCYETPNLEKSITSCAFTHDSRSLVAGYADGGALIWSLDPGGFAAVPPPIEPADSDLGVVWNELATNDGKAALAATWKLARFGDFAVKFLAEQLKPGEQEQVNEKQIKKWIDDLGRGNPAERRAASTQLRQLRSTAEPLLQAAIESDDVPALAKTRIRLLLAASTTGVGEEAHRTIRAIRVLRLIGGDQAETLLDAMANGAPEARESAVARAALHSLRPAEDAEPFEVFSSDEVDVVQHEPVDLDKLPAKWIVDFKTKGLTIDEFVGRIAGRLRLTVEPAPFLRDRLNKQLAIELEGRPYLEALESACREGDLHLIYPRINYLTDLNSPRGALGLSFARGKRKLPVAFAGPFMIECMEVRESPPHGTAILQLVVRGYGLPRELIDGIGRDRLGLPRTFDSPVSNGYLPITIQCKSANGEEFVDRNGGPGWWPSIISPQSYEQVLNVPLKNLLRDQATISNVQIRLTPLISVQTTSMKFDPLQPNVWGRAGGVAAMLHSAQVGRPATGEQQVLNIRWTGAEGRRVGVKVYGADERLTASWRMSQFELNRPRSSSSVPVAGGKDAIAKAIISVEQIKLLEFTTELTNVTLTKSAEQPAKLPEINLEDGKLPVSVEFVKHVASGTRGDLHFRFTNRSNVAIRELYYQAFEDNGKGKVQSVAARSHITPNSIQVGGKPVLLNAGESKVLTHTVSRKVRPGVSYQGKVTRIQFADGREWNAGELSR